MSNPIYPTTGHPESSHDFEMDDAIKVFGLSVYMWSSGLVILVGVLLLAASSAPWLQSSKDIVIGIAGSLIAAGVVSLITVIQRKSDELSTRSTEKRLLLSIDDLRYTVNATSSKLVEFETGIAKLGRAVDKASFPRIIIGHYIAEPSRSLMSAIPENDMIQIDVLGISLKQFFQDQRVMLEHRNNIDARIITLNPDDSNRANVEATIRGTNHSFETFGEEIKHTAETVDHIKDLRARSRLLEPGLRLGLLDGVMTFTGMRINGTWFFRTRFPDDMSEESDIFYSRYECSGPKDEKKVFQILSNHFDAMWLRVK